MLHELPCAAPTKTESKPDFTMVTESLRLAL